MRPVAAVGRRLGTAFRVVVAVMALLAAVLTASGIVAVRTLHDELLARVDDRVVNDVRIAKPSWPGIITSRMTRSGRNDAARARASSPSAAVSTSCPTRRSAVPSRSRVYSSSSATRMRRAVLSVTMTSVNTSA